MDKATPQIQRPSFYDQMVAVQLPVVDPEKFQKRLYDEYRIEIPVYLWNDMPLIRISVQGYNSSEDVDRVIAALSEMLS